MRMIWPFFSDNMDSASTWAAALLVCSCPPMSTALPASSLCRLKEDIGMRSSLTRMVLTWVSACASNETRHQQGFPSAPSVCISAAQAAGHCGHVRRQANPCMQTRVKGTSCCVPCMSKTGNYWRADHTINCAAMAYSAHCQMCSMLAPPKTFQGGCSPAHMQVNLAGCHACKVTHLALTILYNLDLASQSNAVYLQSL